MGIIILFYNKIMSRINDIQQKIKQLDGGSFQKLFDKYLLKKYHFKNICPYGVADGSNKTTKGTPDSYVINPRDGKYTLIMYGSVETNTYRKLENDIKSCLDKNILPIKDNQIEKIICAYCSTNISPSQQENLKNLTRGIPLEIINLGMISSDLEENYPIIASEELGISIDSLQIFSIEDFINVYNKKTSVSPLDTDFLFRKDELEQLQNFIYNNSITLVFGSSGVGKTKLVLETCKHFENKNYKVFCVRSNGLHLDNDLNKYISDEGNYILFLDDANEIKYIDYILSFMNTRNDNIHIKLVITVRDYARINLINKLQEYEPAILKIDRFTNDQIKEIIGKIYNIKNHDYVNQICKISKGNIRLAHMSSGIALREGLNAITNANGIFSAYYSRILDSIKADKNISLILFIIAFLKATIYKLNDITKNLLRHCKISEEIFVKNCDYLNSLEIIDIYEDEIIKINDQNFKDYILNYVLIEKRYISIYDILKICLPNHINQIVEVINLIGSVFYTKDSIDYISKEINKVWNECSTDEEYLFIKYFSIFNTDKTLQYIKNSINVIENFPYDVRNFDIFKESNNKNISSFEISILQHFKRTKDFEIAIELLIQIFNKNSDFIHDTYITLSESFSYDENSYKDDYANEYQLINKLWDICEHGKKINETILLIYIFKKFLEIEYTKASQGNNFRTISILTMPVCYTKGALKLRECVWEILSILYKNKLYKPYVEEFLYNYHVSGSRNKFRTKFIQYDMKCISKYFIKKFSKISFKQAVILNKLEYTYDFMSCKSNNYLRRYKENKKFSYIQNLLPVRHIKNSDWHNDEEKRKEKLKRISKNYTLQDYKNLFAACKRYESIAIKNKGDIHYCLYDLLKELSIYPKKYITVIKLLINSKIRLQMYPNEIVRCLFDYVGVIETEKLIDNVQKYDREIWKKSFFELYPEDKINKNICKKLLKYTNQTLYNKYPQIIPVYSLEKYKKADNKIIEKISLMIYSHINGNNNVVPQFINTYLSIENAKKLVELYKNNLNILKNMYYIFLKVHGDYSGFLFNEIMSVDKDFWNEFTVKISEKEYEDIALSEIFYNVWNRENHEELIDIAVKNILLPEKLFFIEYKSQNIFSNSQNSKPHINERKEKYIQNYIDKNISDIDKLKIIFEVINHYYKNLKMNYYMEFLKLNDDFEDFKQLPLESSTYSFSGSIIPLIDNQIKFLKDLKAQLNESKYIEHRVYLNDLIISKEEEKRQELRREYLENLYF